MKLYASNATGAARDQGKYLTGTRKLKIHQLKHISGWWFQPTPLKNITSWVGMMKFPNIWNKKMFRKQISCGSDTSGNSVEKRVLFFRRCVAGCFLGGAMRFQVSRGPSSKPFLVAKLRNTLQELDFQLLHSYLFLCHNNHNIYIYIYI